MSIDLGNRANARKPKRVVQTRSRNLKDWVAEMSATLKARAEAVMANRTPNAQWPRSRTICHNVGCCQFIKAKGKLKSVTVIDCHITITPGFSVRVACLVMRNDAAEAGEEASMTKLYQPPVPDNLGKTTNNTPETQCLLQSIDPCAWVHPKTKRHPT
jgi:hypothetical protein